MSEPIHFYIGPTGFRSQSIAGLHDDPLVRVHPPVKRFDIPALLDDSEPRTLVLVDGLFHSVPAVGHIEIRDAIEAGWTVWGLSSMGAIRAAEMRELGMRGYGAVFERYLTDPDFSDDEVTLLHEEEPPYRPFTEPMIHIRHFIEDLVNREIVTSATASAVIYSMKNRWFGDRSLTALRMELSKTAGLDMPDVAALLTDFDRHRVRTADLDRFVSGRVWQTLTDVGR